MKFLEIFTKSVIVLLNLLIIGAFIAINFCISYPLGWVVGTLSGINITLCRVISFIVLAISVLAVMNSNTNYNSSNFGKFFILGCMLHHDAHKIDK